MSIEANKFDLDLSTKLLSFPEFSRFRFHFFREFGSNFFANSFPFSRNFRAFAHATSLALFDRFLSFLTDGKNSQIVVNLDLTGFNGRSETREIFILVCLHFEKSLKFGAKPFNGTKKTENRLPLNPSSSIFIVIFRWGSR